MSEPLNDNEPADNRYMSPAEVAQHIATSVRELIAVKLEAELFDITEGTQDERAWKRGWNGRAESMIRELREGRST